jgi:hypothetical protein
MRFMLRRFLAPFELSVALSPAECIQQSSVDFCSNLGAKKSWLTETIPCEGRGSASPILRVLCRKGPGSNNFGLLYPMSPGWIASRAARPLPAAVIKFLAQISDSRMNPLT